jgi:hypothetical protein
MTERKEIQLPPSWCGAICKNAMNDVCVEDCAVKRDCSAFEPQPDISLNDLPRFPLNETQDMSKEEKFTVVTVYLSAITDHLKGVKNESIRIRRPHPNSEGRVRVSENIQSEDLLPHPKETDTPHQDR